MIRDTLKIGGGRVIAMLCLAGALLTASGQTATAESGASASQAALVGTWAVQVTLRDCATDAPFGAPINTLVTFHRGGTLSESAGGLNFAIGQRSPGHGTWTRTDRHTYRQRIVALVLFDTEPNLPGTPAFDPSAPASPGFFAGWTTVNHTVQLTDADHLVSKGTNAFYKADGALYRTGCSTAVAERLN
jgi:hypothetical protein